MDEKLGPNLLRLLLDGSTRFTASTVLWSLVGVRVRSKAKYCQRDPSAVPGGGTDPGYKANSP